MYRVHLLPSAAKQYEQAGIPLARKLARCFEQLQRDPRRHPNIRALVGPFAGFWRFRVGDHGVVYQIDEAARIVTVMKIAHRKDVYE